jgi:hypothetical protein
MENPRTRILSQIISLVVVLVYVWLLIPTHRQQSLQLRALHAGRVACRRAARGMGRPSMRAELSIGTRRYEVPMVLSLGAEWCSRAYDRVRGYPT